MPDTGTRLTPQSLAVLLLTHGGNCLVMTRCGGNGAPRKRGHAACPACWQALDDTDRARIREQITAVDRPAARHLIRAVAGALHGAHCDLRGCTAPALVSYTDAVIAVTTILTPAVRETLGAMADDAIVERRPDTDTCKDCDAYPETGCGTHAHDLAAARSYADLATVLGGDTDA